MGRRQVMFLFSLCVTWLLCMPLTTQVTGQSDTLNRFDEHGRMDGYWMRYNDQGELTYEGRFERGNPAGLFVYYYPNKRLKSTVFYSDKGRDAKTVMFHENGSVMAIGKYYEQKKDSTWKYYNEFDLLVASEEYVLGAAQGPWKKYNLQGDVIDVVHYKNGVKEGDWIQYFDNGNVKMKTSYVADKLHGRMMLYYSNGLPNVAGNYEHSLPVGTWLFYNTKGQIMRKDHYKRGVKVKSEQLIPVVEPDSEEAIREANNFRRQLRNMGIDY